MKDEEEEGEEGEGKKRDEEEEEKELLEELLLRTVYKILRKTKKASGAYKPNGEWAAVRKCTIA